MCPKDVLTPTSDHYLIVLRDFVVMQDLADTISEFDPGAQVIAVAHATAALAAIAPVVRLVLAFVEAAPREFEKTELAAAIASRGGRLVYLGDAAEDAAETGRAVVLRRPFSSQVVRLHLEALAAR